MRRARVWAPALGGWGGRRGKWGVAAPGPPRGICHARVPRDGSGARPDLARAEGGGGGRGNEGGVDLGPARGICHAHVPRDGSGARPSAARAEGGAERAPWEASVEGEGASARAGELGEVVLEVAWWLAGSLQGAA